jgi:outer membrane protein assembly factor BamB
MIGSGSNRASRQATMNPLPQATPSSVPGTAMPTAGRRPGDRRGPVAAALGRHGALARAALAVLAALAAAAGCAPTIWQRAGDPAAVTTALRRVPGPVYRPKNLDGAPLVYLVLEGPKGERIAALDLGTQKVRWNVRAHVTGHIVAGATLIVHADGDAVVARDVASGRERWRFTGVSGRQVLVGYAVDGDQVFVVGRGSNELRGGTSEVLALDGQSGSVRWRKALDTANVAAPAAGAGLVAVPNRSEFVSLFDAASGAPLADVLSKEQAADFVTVLPEGLFYGFGAAGLFRLTPDTAAGVRSSPNYLAAKLPPFVRVTYERDQYRADLIDYSAFDRNRVLWRVEPNGATNPPGARFLDDMVVEMNYRFFFAFEASTGRLRWAYSQPEVESVSAVRQARIILFVTAAGEIVGLDPASGARTYDLLLADEVVRGAAFDTEGFAGGAAGPAPLMSSVLSGMVRDPDLRFPDMKLFATDEMRGVPGTAVTAELLRILADEELPPEVRKRAGAVLVARKDSDSIPLLVEALRVHADRLTGTRPWGLASLAEAAGALEAREAAEPLAEQLGLPETDPAAAAAIAHALAEIGADSALPALRDYLCFYRADPAFEGDPLALFSTVDALAGLGHARERELLFFVAEEPRTLPALKEHIRRAVAERSRGR